VIATAALAFVMQLRVNLDVSLDPGLRARVHAVADELRSEGVPRLRPLAADARPLNVMIMLDPQSPENLSHVKALEWVKVTGRLTFRKRKDRDEYVTVLMVASPSDVKSTEPDPRPYIQ